jgi:hypothetical protein
MGADPELELPGLVLSGKNGDYEAVASAAGDRWEYLGNRFAEALPTIEDRLQLHT